MTEAELPEAAQRRLGRGVFSSGLTVPDFASCLHMGLRPVGLVQGFCVMRWSNYGVYGAGVFSGGQWGGFSGQGVISSYNCPHGMMMGQDHRIYGANIEQDWAEKAWADGFNAAYQRMADEALDAGGHGIIGVIQNNRSLIGSDIREFHLLGTAVAVEGQAAGSGPIWSTFLAGQRLAKLLEAGFMPVSVVGAFASVYVYAVCVTKILSEGGYDTYGYVTPGQEITQLADAQMSARRRARDHVRSRLGTDALHGADLEVEEHEHGEGDATVNVILRGTRVRRFRAAADLPAPMPTVRLA